jgi:hypothetical protein
MANEEKTMPKALGAKETEARYATIDIMRPSDVGSGVRYQTVWVSKSEWADLHYIDYIELDSQGNLMPEYQRAYSPEVQTKMLALVDRAS